MRASLVLVMMATTPTLGGGSLRAFLTPSRQRIIEQAERVEIFRLDPYAERRQGFGGYAMLKEGGPLPPAMAARAKAIVLAPTSYEDPCATGTCVVEFKLCGGFQPRHGLRFWSRGPTGSRHFTDVLICLWCGDLGIVRPGEAPGFIRLRGVLVASLTKQAEQQLRDLIDGLPQLEDGVTESVPVWLSHPEEPEPAPDPRRPPALERREMPVVPGSGKP